MKDDVLRIDCPKQLRNSAKSFSFLLSAQEWMRNFTGNTIVWNMANTKGFDVNQISIIYFIFQEQWKQGKCIKVVLPGNIVCEEGNTLLFIFNYYAEDRRAFFKPRLITGEKIRETEDVLLKFLKKLELENYDKFKTLISELFANIKMHTDRKVGYITGQLLKEENVIMVSIANGDYSIAKQLEMKRGMIFRDDYSALLWAFRKSNSTRDDKESGGLGLYLLRKYIHELNGSVTILSGKCFLELDYSCFDSKDENRVVVHSHVEMVQEYKGTVFTVTIPNITVKNERKEEIESARIISLLEVLEEDYGMR